MGCRERWQVSLLQEGVESRPRVIIAIDGSIARYDGHELQTFCRLCTGRFHGTWRKARAASAAHSGRQTLFYGGRTVAKKKAAKKKKKSGKKK